MTTQTEILKEDIQNRINKLEETRKAIKEKYIDSEIESRLFSFIDGEIEYFKIRLEEIDEELLSENIDIFVSRNEEF